MIQVNTKTLKTKIALSMLAVAPNNYYSME